MLAGHPAFRFKGLKDDEVRQAVKTSNAAPMNRTDLAEDINTIVFQSLEKMPARRQADIRTFAKMLRTKFGEVPPEKAKRQFDRRFVAAGAFTFLMVVVWMFLSAALQR